MREPSDAEIERTRKNATKGVETDADIAWRKNLRRTLGCNL
jgi:hypothetical protein